VAAPPPLALILARNLIERLDVAAFLVGDDGVLWFFNETAGQLIGRRFEEMGRAPREQWNEIGPFDADGTAISSADLPLTRTLREGTPAHGRFHIRTDPGPLVEVEVVAFPLTDAEGFHGAVVLFWAVQAG
jgi:PAS domain-containing protein